MNMDATTYEPGLESVIDYLDIGNVRSEKPSVRRAVKINAKNFVIFQGHLYRRTAKGLIFVAVLYQRTSILLAFHDEIGHWDFCTTYKILSEWF